MPERCNFTPAVVIWNFHVQLKIIRFFLQKKNIIMMQFRTDMASLCKSFKFWFKLDFESEYKVIQVINSDIKSSSSTFANANFTHKTSFSFNEPHISPYENIPHTRYLWIDDMQIVCKIAPPQHKPDSQNMHRNSHKVSDYKLNHTTQGQFSVYCLII